MGTLRANSNNVKRALKELNLQKGWEKALQQQLDNYLTRKVNYIRRSLEPTFIRSYQNGVRSWFRNAGSDGGVKLLQATTYSSNIHKGVYRGKKAIFIDFTATINPKIYARIGGSVGIIKWAKRHIDEMSIRSKSQLVGLVLQRQTMDGIIGLPKTWTRPNYRLGVTNEPYINPYYKETVGLKKYLGSLKYVGEVGHKQMYQPNGYIVKDLKAQITALLNNQ